MAVSIVFCLLAWRDFARKRRQEAVKAAESVKDSTSLMLRTGVRIGFQALSLLVGAYLVTWIGVDLLTVAPDGTTMADELGGDAAMALTAYFGFVVPESRQLACIHGAWITGWLLLAYAGLGLPLAGETLAYAVLPSRPVRGLYGE